MKKFGIALLGLLMLFITPVLVACNTVEQIYRVKVVEFTEERVALSVDSQPYQLEWEVEDNVAINQKVTFESSNTKVATVSETGLVTPLSSGVTVISVKSDDNPKAKTNTCTVQVLPRKQTLAMPLNLRYVANTQQVTWDKVVENTSGDLLVDTSAFVPKYEVTLTTQEGTTKEVVSSNVYDELQPGQAYAISVKALGNQYLYNDSASTQNINVHIISAPTNLKVSTATQYGQLETGDVMNENASAYQNREYTLSFSLPADGGQNVSDYQISFLNANLEPVSGATKTATDALINQAVIENKTFVMPLDSTLPSGDYFVRVCALGDADHYVYDSNYAWTKRIVMLSAPTNLVLSGENKQMVSWNSTSYANAYKVLIQYKYTNIDTDPYYYATYYVKNNQNSSFSLENLKDVNNNLFLETDYYIFNIYLYALGDDTPTILDSARSTDTARAQLSQVKNVRLATARDASMDIALTWNSVANAGGYKVDVYKDRQIIRTENVDTNQFIINVNASYLTQGEYSLTVCAVPTVNQNYTTSTPSEPFDIYKLATPTLSTTNGLISWDRVDYVDATYGYKLKYMKGAELVTLKFNNAQSTYDFSADVLDSGNYTDCTITACGSTVQSVDNTYIDSMPSATYTITKMALPNKFEVSNGILSLTDARFGLFELKVTNDATGELVNNMYLSNETVASQINTIVNGLSRDVNYTFSLVALKPSSQNDNVLYVKSNTTETSVYVSENVTDVKAVNGVITWKMPTSLFNLIKSTSAGQTVLNPRMLNSVRYLITNDQNTNALYVNAVTEGVLSQNATVVLPNMTANTEFKLGVQMVFANADNPTVCILNANTVYADFYQLGTTNITDIVDDNDNWLIKWPKSSLSNIIYDLEIRHTDSQNEEHVATMSFEDITLDDDITNTYHTLTLTSALLGFDLDEGNYSVFLTVRPSINEGVYLTSYKSATPFTFTKLAAPTLTVNDGALTWVAPSALANLTYNLDINGSIERDINRTTYYLTNVSGEISLRIQAISSTPNILSSVWSQTIKVVKLNSATIAINDAKVTNKSLTWTYTPTVEIAGNPVEIEISTFNYTVALMDNPINILSRGEIEATDDGAGGKEFIYEMPLNSSFGAGVYILTLTPLTSDLDNDVHVSGIAGFLDGDPYCTYIYKMPQVNDAIISNDKVSWTVNTLSSINGNNLSSALDIIYKVRVSTLSDYNYVVLPGTSDNITKGDVDVANGVYNYLVKPNDSKYTIPLQKQTFTDEHDDGGIVQNINVIKGFNYVAPGTTFNLSIYSTLNTHKVTEDGANPMTYYVFDANPAIIKNISLLDAPTVQFNKGVMTWSNSKTNFDKIVYTFTPYTLNTATRELEAIAEPQLTELTKTEIFPSYNTRSYDLSRLFNSTNDGIYYVMSAQSVGNGSRTISSRKTDYSYAITNVPDILINTQSTTTNSDGWYVESGAVCWKTIAGVASYLLRFEQVKTDEHNVQTITRTIEISIPTNTEQTYYRYIPDSEMYLTGDFYLTLKAIGGVYNQSSNLYNDYVCKIGSVNYAGIFANSKYIEDNSAKQILHQLSTNDTMYVKNGELTWENAQKQVVSGYEVKINDIENEPVAVIDKAQDTAQDELSIVFSDANKDTDQYYSTIRALGTSWVGRNTAVPANGIYLTSRYGSQFNFRYINADDILPQVVNGTFSWNVSNMDVSNWGALYTIGLTQNDGDDVVWLDRQSTMTNDLSSYATPAKCSIYSLGVKVIGSDDSTRSQQGIPLVNSTVSRLLYNLYKLPDIANFADSGQQIVINQIGDIVWNCGYTGELTSKGLQTAVRISRLNGQTQELLSSTTNSIGVKPLDANNTYNYEINSAMPSNSISPIYKFDINVMGSDEYQYEIAAGAATYLSSNWASIQAPKYTSVTSFSVIDGVNLTWDPTTSFARIYDQATTSSSINRPDMIMIEYVDTDHFDINTNKLDEGASFTLLTMASTFDDVDLTSIAQFLPNGEYVFKLSTYNSSGEIFRSAPVYCRFNNSTAINFGVFEEFEVINNKPYFDISTSLQLQSVRYVLNSNILENNGTMTLIGSNQTINVYTVAKGANYKLLNDIALSNLIAGPADNLHDDNITLNAVFDLYGVFDGAGYTISNVNMLNSLHPGLFDTIHMGAVVKDLTLQYSKIDVKTLGYSYDANLDYVAPTDMQYFGLIANNNYGLVKNCKVTSAQENVLTEDYFDETDLIVMGMIVGYNGHTVLEDESVVRGQVVGCINGINMTRASAIQLNQNIQLGGIVGENDGADIINCTNGIANDNTFKGNLMGYCLGGIAYMNLNGALVMGCTNYGTLNIFASKEINPATAGGIVAFNQDANIIYCENRGNINARNIVMTVSYNSATIGGIVGKAYHGSIGSSIITNCLQTYDTGEGLHVHFVGGEGESGSAWEYVYIGYIIGQEVGSDTITVRDCAYKEYIVLDIYGQPDTDAQAYYANKICGNADDGDYNYITSIGNDLLSVVNTLNNISTTTAPYITSINNVVPVFATADVNIKLMFVDEDAYNQIANIQAQTKVLSVDNTYIIDGFDTSVINYDVMYSDNEGVTFVTNVPTTAGEYIVKVSFYITISAVNYVVGVYTYNYTLTAE